jgi:hypothetical protein
MTAGDPGVSETHVTQLPCWRLRSKNMFVNAVPEPGIPQASDGFFWCTHTMNCMGPDGKVANTRSCVPDRACYETR